VSAREAFARWCTSAASDPALADDLERIGRIDLPARDPWRA
jgi:hypothetical protein